MRRAAVTGWGMALPERVMSNDDFTSIVETSDEWITARTGIRERRFANPGESGVSFALDAAREALDVAKLDANDLDLIIVGTFTADQQMPSMASLVQSGLGAKRAGAFDLNAACSGFVYSLVTGAQFIESGRYRRVLVVGVDINSRFLDFTDRGTCILFGDGAGAVVLEASTAPEGLLSVVLGSDGANGHHLTLGDTTPLSGVHTERDMDRPFMKMNGREVFRFAVRVMIDATQEVVHSADLALSDIDLLIPHQANQRIIDAAVDRMAFPQERVWVNLDRYGNTSAASVPICLVEAVRAGALTDGKHLAMVAFGGGLTWAAGVIRWGSEGVNRADRR